MYDIVIENATKRFSDKLAVDNLSLTIQEGELFGLLGPNGAGKSTLISMLCGLISMDQGEIWVGGHSLKKEPLKAKQLIGYVPQELALFENLSVMDNLQYFGRIYGLKGKELRSKIVEALDISSLGERKKSKVKELSGGMKRRLNIACSILHEPRILIMDEPTVGIDPQSRNHILEFTRRINRQQHTTVLYTSHYMEEIESLCSNLMILDLGREIVKGTKQEILRTFTDETTIEILTVSMDPKVILPLTKLNGVKEARIEDEKLKLLVKSTSYQIEDIFNTLTSHHCQIKNLSIKEPNLESIFLSITGKNLRD